MHVRIPHPVIFSLLLVCGGCTTTTTTTDVNPFASTAAQQTPPAVPKQQGGSALKNTMTGAQALAFGAGNVTKSAAQNVGSGAGWVAGEFLRPLNTMREGMIDAFGVVQPEKK